MKLRSISYFFPGQPRDDMARFERCGSFLAAARSRFEDEGLEVQTVRLVLGIPEGITPEELVENAFALDELCEEAGIDFATVGALPPDAPAELAAVVPALLEGTGRVFAASRLVDGSGVQLDAVRDAAEIIHRNAQASADGFQNLRYAALGSVPPGVPFLPAAYHDGSADSFSIATESADLAVRAFAGADTLSEAREALVEALEREGREIARIAHELGEPHALPFGGIDFSLAPYPEFTDSIGAAFESLGLPAFGGPGSAAAAAFLTSCLDAVDLPRCGFCGLFLPVLEDEILARRAGEGTLGVTELLLASAVCGTGLDTVPLPGDIASEEIAAILLDMAAMSVRLDKPLTARLMPMPGKAAGDELHFDFPYFATGKVLAHGARALSGLLAHDHHLPIARR